MKSDFDIIMEAACKTNDALNAEKNYPAARAFALFCQYLEFCAKKAAIKEERQHREIINSMTVDGQR